VWLKVVGWLVGRSWGVGSHFTGGSRIVAARSTFKMKVLPQGLGDGSWAPDGALSQSSDGSLFPTK